MKLPPNKGLVAPYPWAHRLLFGQSGTLFFPDLFVTCILQMFNRMVADMGASARET